MAVADGGEGRGQHHAFDTRVAGDTEHAESAVTGRNDQLIFVLGESRREGRGDVQHVIAAGDRLEPASITFQIGGKEGEAVHCVVGHAALFQHGADAGFTVQVTDGSADAVAGVEKLEDGVTRNEAGAARHQYGRHRESLGFCWAGSI